MRMRKLLSLLLTAVTAGLAGAFVVLFMLPQQTEKAPALNPPQVSRPAIDMPRESGPFSYAQAVASASPSVVNIFTAKITTESQSLRFRDPLLQHLFGNMLPEQTRRRLDTSLGSGVIVSEDGYLLTNHHVIEGADEIKVVLANGKSVSVSIVGSDAESDLAVLKIDTDTPLQAIRIDSSGRQQVGDVVLAIGNPFGVGQTVTMGIISATGRSHLGINTFENFIQTDAAINPGNSGGALVNARGELIGINTAIFSKTGGSHGIGFAIPFDLAEGIMQQLISSGHVVRGWLGIQGQDVTDKLAEAFSLHNSEGILVTGVMEDGPASTAGLRPGDVITRVNSTRIDNSQQLVQLIASQPPGTRLTIGGWRGNEEIQLETISGERPAIE
ncbi:MAG: transcriptional regulator [gamma proteobacterium symbiont of Ctena orbiculata]|uniref:Trypsin-like peptidase domain-containing protein n=1 Tax=Candidatus Thiodiazotropha taylori TaxID=2792791 RepID=A0A944QV82_9GAMM|nr:trypsin-like peptidase domain-containing protein [Candidatus Thiodiazotropha taylori]PUB85526.1 MAG: transcriptional regulator [gamma proteobacterium symbiont of Ctena orbiculata]MBT2990947.1 trypsin-like peptidase domain-containing protein [Candidatus Thiodiazotropha taylori]MBT2998672.1 trypsin-like peptidase domain-containing protein [Candidatus Thiodiazotropha taylori]MBT3002786.1 trypsin-like peptidase domain-containing protein [Candidatus Thiodiazotropha taylori]